MWPQRGKEGAADSSYSPEAEWWTDSQSQWRVGPDGVWRCCDDQSQCSDGLSVSRTWVPYEEEKQPAVAAPPAAGSAQEAASVAESAAGRAQEAAGGRAQQAAAAAAPAAEIAQEAAA